MENNMNSADLILKYKELFDSGVITEEEFQEKKKQLLNGTEPNNSAESNISKRTTGIIAYITWIGFLIALLVGDKKGAMFHINQALVVNLFAFGAVIPFVGWIWAIFICVCWIMGMVYAYKEQEKEVPLIGKIKILK